MLVIKNNENDDNKKLFQHLHIICHVHKWHARLLRGVWPPRGSFVPSSRGDTMLSVSLGGSVCSPRSGLSLLRAVRHSPQPQVECCRPSPFNPDRAASTYHPRLHYLGREACSPTRGIQGSGPAHPPTTTLSPHCLHGGIRPASRGLTQGAPASVGEAAESPQAHAG